MTTVPVDEARQNFSALVDEAITTNQRVLVTRNGVPAVWMISDEDFGSIMETLDVLADAATTRDVAQSRVDLRDDAVVVADLHARGLPDSVCLSTLRAIISMYPEQAR